MYSFLFHALKVVSSLIGKIFEVLLTDASRMDIK